MSRPWPIQKSREQSKENEITFRKKSPIKALQVLERRQRKNFGSIKPTIHLEFNQTYHSFSLRCTLCDRASQAVIKTCAIALLVYLQKWKQECV